MSPTTTPTTLTNQARGRFWARFGQGLGKDLTKYLLQNHPDITPM